jgi:glutamate 5-kinase
VRDLDAAFGHVRPDKGEESVGGMKTKLEAVKLATSAKIPVHILDGRRPGQIAAALAGEDVGTRFPVAKK